MREIKACYEDYIDWCAKRDKEFDRCSVTGRIDCIVVDSVDHLLPERRSKDRWVELEETILEAVAIARDLQIPIVTTSQVNRSGYSRELDHVGLEHMAGALAKAMPVGCVFAVEQTPEDRAKHQFTLMALKGRRAELVGWAFPMKVHESTQRIVENMNKQPYHIGARQGKVSEEEDQGDQPVVPRAMPRMRKPYNLFRDGAPTG